jgi:hypothetical protein
LAAVAAAAGRGAGGEVAEHGHLEAPAADLDRDRS